MMGDFMAGAWSVICVITLLGFIIWWLFIFVFELINASDIVRSANINISKGLSERVGALDEINRMDLSTLQNTVYGKPSV